MAPKWFGKKAKKLPTGSSKNVPPAASGAARASRAPKGDVRPVLVGRLLTEDLVLLGLPSQDKERLLEALVRKLCSVRSLPDSALLLGKVLERERGVGTTLDTGLSLPHARVDGLAEIAAILGLVPSGMQDPRQPDLVIKAVFLFFSPNAPSAFTRHLQLLRSVSALFQPGLIEQLSKAGGPGQALELLRRQESS